MRIVLIVLILCLAGCAQERAQQGADIRAGIQALAQTAVDDVQRTILAGMDARLSAAVEAPNASFPPPTMTAQDIVKDSTRYANSAPPEHAGWSWVAILGGVGGAAAIALRLGKNLPGIAGALATFADYMWKQTAPVKAHAADAAATAALAALDALAPTIASFRSLNPDTWNRLPNDVRTALEAALPTKTP
jgi:hypothetical protein